MNADLTLERSEDVAYQLVAGEAILIRLSTGTYYSLNPIGTEFWNMLDGMQTIAQHADALAGRYNAKVEALASELHGLAESLPAEPAGPAKAGADLRELAAGLPDRYQVADPPVAHDLLALATSLEESRPAETATVASRIRALSDSVSKKYHVDAAVVLEDLIALAEKLLSDRLVRQV